MASSNVLRVILTVLVTIAVANAARRINVRDQVARARRSFGSPPQNSKELMGLTRGEDLEESKELATHHGTKKVKFIETYDGIPVVGATAVVEQDASGHFMEGTSGHLVSNIDDDISSSNPRLSAKEALHTAMRYNRHNRSEVRYDDTMDSKLEIILEDGQEEDSPVARLVYRVSYMVQTDDDLERPFTLVDAITGDVVKQWNGLSLNRASDDARVKGDKDFTGMGGNLKMGKANYGKEFPKLKVNVGCMLENNVARIYSCKGSRCSQKPFSFNCKEGFNDTINGAYSPMTDALFYISATYEMFDKWYGIKNPLQRKHSSQTVCQSRVHYGYRFENAFWDGTYITFGDGYNRFYPLTSINVVAHEISHGVTEMNSGLIYSGESGGMNEAFSDMAGEAVEYYATQKQDWMVGYEIFKDPEGALRYFNEPSKDGKSIGDLKEYCPGIDVHYSSGLFNRAFYFLGKTEGWNVRSAFHPFVVANELYWTENSKFFEGACGVVQAAKDLDLNASDVTEAFRKVGIEPCVDTSRGLAATSNLKGPVGHTIRAQFVLDEKMNITKITIKTKTQVPATLQLTSPTCTHCEEKVIGYSTKTFEICHATPGVYEMGLTPTEKDMWKGAVGFYGPSTPIIEDLSMSGYRSMHHFEFEIPASFDKYGFQATLYLSSSYGYVAGYVRYNEKPDMKNYKFDLSLRRGSERLICNPKAGTWYGVLKAYDYRVRGVSLELRTIMTGRRVDVISTTAAPTPPPTTAEPSSGEGSGSGAY